MSLSGTDSHRDATSLPPVVQRALEAARTEAFDLSCRLAHGRLLAILAGDDPRVTILEGEWSTLGPHGPFDLLSLDGGGQGKGRKGAIDPVEWLRPGGTLVMDDFAPADAWPPRYGGEVDAVRLRWLEHPRLFASEIRTEPDQAAIIATLPYR